ncbi:hypothetical protein FXO38_27676 [Capsicum annuum]|nr:hypothetical protein FXO38_27676 [Capsicum annuum]
MVNRTAITSFSYAIEKFSGEVLDFCVKGIILKVADWMIVASGGAYDTKNLQECMGSAVIAMGPEKQFS